MRKFILLGLSVAAAMAFTMKTNKVYQCETFGISFYDGNQTRNIINNKRTKPLLQKSLKVFYAIKVMKKNDKTVELMVGKIKQDLQSTGTWKGYHKYVSPDGGAVFMPDKNTTSNNAALVLPMDKLVIYYKCK